MMCDKTILVVQGLEDESELGSGDILPIYTEANYSDRNKWGW
jgi:hypothetical protein